MSLINEALKQAEMDRRGLPDQAQPVAELMTEPMESPAPAMHRRRLPIKVISAAVLLVVVFAMWVAIQTAGQGPTTAQAAAKEPTSPQTRPLQANLDQAKAQKNAAEISPPSAKPDQPTQVKADIEEPFTFESIADLTPKIPTVAEKKIENQVTETPQSKEIAPVTTSKNPQAELTVTGIFHGPGGSRVLINGQMLRRGQRIGRGTVVRIGTDTVDLDIGGQTITLGM